MKNQQPKSLSEFINEQRQLADGSLLLCRVGDFYELFDEQAEIAAKLLGLVVASRGNRRMAGFPYHSLHAYQEKLEASGHSVRVVHYKPRG